MQFLTPFMMSATGVALPAIGREFNAGAVHLGLIEMVYILAVTLLLLPSGRFADIHGRKKIFITGASIMTVATLFLAMSMNIRFFIVLRFFQGVGAAMITATSMAIITSVIPRHKLGQAMGIIIACVYMGLSAGPTLAGIMITNFGWRWIFYAAVPLELAALLLTVVKLKGEWAGARGQKFDWAGSLIYMTALFALITGAAGLEKVHGALWLAGAGGVLLVVFLFFEARIPSPLLDMHLLATNRVFTFSNIATWINYAACFGFLFFFSIYLQSVKGLPAQTAGLILVIQPGDSGHFLSHCRPSGRPVSASLYCHHRHGDLHCGPGGGCGGDRGYPHGNDFPDSRGRGPGIRHFFIPQYHGHHEQRGPGTLRHCREPPGHHAGGRHAGQHDPHHRYLVPVYGGPRRGRRHDSRFHHQHAHRVCLFFVSVRRGRGIFICSVSGKRKDTAQNNEVKTYHLFHLPSSCIDSRVIQSIKI